MIRAEREAETLEFPGELRYTSDDEWLRLEGGDATVGITDHAQDQLGDVVYVELPEVGRRVERGQSFGVVESVKAVSDLLMPVSGEVIERNVALEQSPDLVNKSPYDEGWMIRIRVANAAEVDQLLTAVAYRAQLPAEPAG